jgi:hypothetical protein
MDEVVCEILDVYFKWILDLILGWKEEEEYYFWACTS